MSILRVAILGVFSAVAVCAQPQEEKRGLLVTQPPPAGNNILSAIKSPDLSDVHLWAPWCSNCQSELKSGGWLKMVKANPDVKFYFVCAWNAGEDGKAMLTKYELVTEPNVTILADPGPRKGDDKIKRFLDLPV